MATTSCPTRSREASPSTAGARSEPDARTTARSDSGSVPMISMSNSRPSENAALPPSEPTTTCAEVRMYPSGVITTPLPPPSPCWPRNRRVTRRLVTDGDNDSATRVMTFE